MIDISTGTHVSVSDRDNGTYWYRLKGRATNMKDSEYSNVVTVTVIWIQQLDIPSFTSINRTVNVKYYNLSWDRVPNAINYTVEEYADKLMMDHIMSRTTTDTEMDFTNRINGTYYYRIRSVAQGIESPWSPLGWITVKLGAIDTDNDPPFVSIDVPGNDSVVSGLQPIQGTAGDPDGDDTVDLVQIRIPGAILDWTTAEGTQSWSYLWNTTDLSDGDYTIWVRSFDGFLNSQVALITVHLNNSAINGSEGEGEGERVRTASRFSWDPSWTSTETRCPVHWWLLPWTTGHTLAPSMMMACSSWTSDLRTWGTPGRFLSPPRTVYMSLKWTSMRMRNLPMTGWMRGTWWIGQKRPGT
jgi:hypothetical protein